MRLATTPATLAWLERVWRREETIAGLPLAEPDEIALAQELAVRQVPAWRRDPRRAAGADLESRSQGAVRVRAAGARRRPGGAGSRSSRACRRWRTGGASRGCSRRSAYLHHPLRAAACRALRAPSLEMLEEIRRTGDIFFPRRWLDATLGGHRSRAVADTVHAFLAARPDYPPRLRRIVLQVADELYLAAGVPEFRAARVTRSRRTACRVEAAWPAQAPMTRPAYRLSASFRVDERDVLRHRLVSWRAPSPSPTRRTSRRRRSRTRPGGRR